MNIVKRIYKRIFEEIYYLSPYPIRSKIAFFIYSKDGYEWAKQNDLDLSKDSYPPKRGSEKIYSHDFNDVIPIFENTLLKNLLIEKSLFIQIGASSGKDIAYFAKKFKSNKFIYTDVALGAVNYAKQRYGDLQNITFIQSDATEIAKINHDSINRHQKLILLIKGIANYVDPKKINLIFKQFSEINKDIYIFLCDGVKTTNNLKKIFEGKMRYMSFSHNYKKIGETENFITVEWKQFHPPEGDLGHTRVFGIFHKKA